MTRVCGVTADVPGLLSETASEDVFEGGQCGPHNLLCGPHHTLQVLAVLGCTTCGPHCTAIRQDGLDGRTVEVHQKGAWEVSFPWQYSLW